MVNLKTIILFLSLVTLSGEVLASRHKEAIPKDLQKEFASKRVSIDSIPEFSCIQNWLQRLVNRRGTGTAPHDLYISKVGTDSGGDRYFRVYWPKDNSIVIFFINKLGCNASSKLDDVDAQFELEWLATKARIDLKTGVVPTMAEVGSSTYLVDKPWVDSLIADCKKNGKMISLTPRSQLSK